MRYIRLVIFLLGASGALYESVVLLFTRPAAPTVIALEKWKDEFHGQEWIQVSGKLASDQIAIVRRVERDGRPSLYSDAFVPLRPRGSDPATPADVVAIYGPIEHSRIKADVVAETSIPHALITGMKAPDRVYKPVDLFPAGEVSPTATFIYDGQEPPSTQVSVILLLISCVMLIVPAAMFWLGWRKAKAAERRAPKRVLPA